MRKIVSYLFCYLSVVLFIACGPQEPPRITVTGIVLDKVKATLTEGETTTLVPTITPADATDKSVRWSSSNQAVATVTDGGVVSALHAGTAVITATTNDGGITATCTVTVDIEMAAMTGEASHISCRNATLSGKANLPGTTATDLTFGVLYSTNSGVLLGSAVQIQAKSFDSNYNFTVNTEVLEPETTYYYRSYISQNNEITYGDTKSFTTLPVSSMIETMEVTDIEATVATLHGKLDLTDCRYDALEYGFKLTPQGGQETILRSSDLSAKSFSIKAEGLSREKAYDIKAYVTLDGRTYLAEKKEFSTQTIQASVSLNDVTVITEFKATISGKLTVTSQGSFEKTAKLFYSSSVQAASELQSTGTSKTLSLASDGSFSQVLTGLSPSTTYHYVVVSTVDGATFMSEVKNFMTATVGVNLTANDVTDITEFKGTLHGTLMVTSIESVSKEVWFYYSATAASADNLKLQGTKVTASLGSDGTFSKQLTGLTENTTYYFVACAKVNGKDYVSEVKSFKTMKLLAESTTNEATNVFFSKASLNGHLSIASEGTVWFFYSKSSKTLEGLIANGIKVSSSLCTNGSFSSELIGLESGTTYYYVACAEVSGTLFYGNTKSFKTKSLPDGAVDLGLSVLWATQNIGAGNGDFYSWGDTNTHLNYSWNNYPYGSSFTTSVTKYCTNKNDGTVVDSLLVLELSDDVAYQKLKDNWRIPLESEWTELVTECNWSWVTESGTKGYRIESKRPEYQGRSIFLPAAGYKGGEDNPLNVNVKGYYWSASLDASKSKYAKYLLFDSSSYSVSSSLRISGYIIRPVFRLDN